ncbi:MAG: hypothetical protein AAGE76_01735 [Pseudomonadota bacterium]
MRIACLHTTSRSIAVYEAAVPCGVALAHHLRSDLLYRARTGAGTALAAETNVQLARMANGVDAVLATGSTLADAVAPPAFSATALLAEAAAEEAGDRSVDVLYTHDLAAPAIRRLFQGRIPADQLTFTAIPDAWAALHAGDSERHDCLVRRAVAESTAERLVLVQATMADCAPDDPRIIRTPRAALSRLTRLLGA